MQGQPDHFRFFGHLTTAVFLLLAFIFTGHTFSAFPLQTFTVDSQLDEPDANPGDGVCDSDPGSVTRCTLRAAIQEANSLSGADTIMLPAGTYALTTGSSGEDNSAGGDLDIREALTLQGAGASRTIIEGSNLDRVLDLHDPTFEGMDVTISGVTIQHGNVADSGGGIFVRTGTSLTLSDSTVRENTADGGDGGGGIYVQGSASLLLTGSSVIDNQGVSRGGGINNNNALTVTNSTLSGNMTTGSGGGIYSNHTTTLNNVTIANNSASVGGGLSIEISTVLTASNTIVAGNRFPNSQPSDCNGTLIAQGYNLIQNMTNCTISGDLTGTVTGADPQLDTLKLNGGTTFSHALATGSPAIDAGNPAAPGSSGNACAATDQRGVARPVDGDDDGNARCDIGAFEWNGSSLYLPAIIRQ